LEWRDRAGLNGCWLAEPWYMKRRTVGHTETTISGDTRADRSDAFALTPSVEVAYVWHASKFTRDVVDGMLRIGFLHHQQIIRTRARGSHAHASPGPRGTLASRNTSKMTRKEISGRRRLGSPIYQPDPNFREAQGARTQRSESDASAASIWARRSSRRRFAWLGLVLHLEYRRSRFKR